jgi:hypothetical protein
MKAKTARDLSFAALIVALVAFPKNSEARTDCGSYHIYDECLAFTADYPTPNICEMLHPGCCAEFCEGRGGVLDDGSGEIDYCENAEYCVCVGPCPDR